MTVSCRYVTVSHGCSLKAAKSGAASEYTKHPPKIGATVGFGALCNSASGTPYLEPQLYLPFLAKWNPAPPFQLHCSNPNLLVLSFFLFFLPACSFHIHCASLPSISHLHYLGTSTYNTSTLGQEPTIYRTTTRRSRFNHYTSCSSKPKKGPPRAPATVVTGEHMLVGVRWYHELQLQSYLITSLGHN